MSLDSSNLVICCSNTELCTLIYVLSLLTIRPGGLWSLVTSNCDGLHLQISSWLKNVFPLVTKRWAAALTSDVLIVKSDWSCLGCQNELVKSWLSAWMIGDVPIVRSDSWSPNCQVGLTMSQLSSVRIGEVLIVTSVYWIPNHNVYPFFC